MFPIINLGPISLPAPQFILFIGVWLGSALSERRAKKASRDTEILFKIIWISLIAGILGARLSFVARNPAAFQGQWISLLSINQASLDPASGFLIAFTAGYFVAARNQMAKWALLDDLVPFFAVLIPAVFLSNFASGSGFGTFTDLPWGIDLWGGSRHPVQLYYLSASLIVLLLILSSSTKVEIPGGNLMISFIVYTSGYLTVLAYFQESAGSTLLGFRILQLISWGVFTLFVILLYINNKEKVKNEVV